jgi:hypothetical protein
MTESVTAPQPPRVQATCSFGHVTRSRNPPGTVIPCVRCNVEHGRTVMVTVPTAPGNRPMVPPPPLPPTPAGLAVISRKKTTSTAQCSAAMRWHRCPARRGPVSRPGG